MEREVAMVGWLLARGHRKLRGVCVRAFAPEHPAVEVVRGHPAARHLVLHPVEEIRADLKRLHAEAGLPQCVHQSDGDRGLAYA